MASSSSVYGRVLLVDGSAIMHRAYYALPQLNDGQGRPTGAIYGFVRMLLKAIKELQPKYVVVAFDRPEPTFRKQMFIGYQAQRAEMEPELAEQFDRVRQLLQALEIPVVEKPGFEADDLLGTLSLQAKQQAKRLGINQIVILTGDKDLMQLVDDQVNLYLPVKGVSEAQLIDKQAVIDKLGITPEQVVDYKALVGDPSDNYPGVHGIGPKTAVKLLAEYHDWDNLWQHLDDLPKSVREKLVQGKSGGELSRQLARIKRDVDLTMDWNQAKTVVDNPAHLQQVLQEFGFHSLVKQLNLEQLSSQKQLQLI